MKVIVDSFCHVYTQEYIQELRNLGSRISFRSDVESGVTRMIDTLTNDVFQVYKDRYFDTAKRLQDMERFGVDMQVLTVGTPGIHASALHLLPHEKVKLARVLNDALSKLAEKHPNKIVAIGEVPLPQVDEAVDEMERCVKDLGLRGIQLYTTIDGIPIDSGTFMPIFDKAAHMGVPIHLHPTHPLWSARRNYERDYALSLIFGYPFESTLSITRLILSGVLDQYPNLKLITHHTGAMCGIYVERLQSFIDDGSVGTKPRKLVKEYVRMLYHDTAVSGSVATLNLGAAVFGADRLLFGTDYPFGPENGCFNIRETIRSVGSMSATREEREKIFYRNAQGLFKF